MNGTGGSPLPVPSEGFSGFAPETVELKVPEIESSGPESSGPQPRRFLIRRAVESDLTTLVALLQDDVLGAQREGAPVQREDAPTQREGAEDTAPDDLDAYRRAFELIAADPNQLLVAIEEEPTALVVGTLQLSLLPSLSRRGSTRLQIEAVRIGRRAQGIGLGTAVFDWAHTCGRRFGASLAQLTTDKSRGDAQRFYARLGYTASHEGLKLDLGD